MEILLNVAPVMSWVAGGFIALGLGHALVLFSLRALEKHTHLPPRQESERVPPALVGFLERLVFGTLVAFNGVGALTGMMGWIGLKMAANWNSKETGEEYKSDPSEGYRALLNRRFIALFCNGVAMICAGIGGAIVKMKLELPLEVWPGVAGVALVLWVAAVVLKERKPMSRLDALEKRVAALEERLIASSPQPQVATGSTSGVTGGTRNPSSGLFNRFRPTAKPSNATSAEAPTSENGQ